MDYSGAEIIAEYLVKEQVPYCFGLCGHGILGFLDALYDRRDRLKTISTHHESVAGFMADAYFRVAGRPVATYTSCGPGSANLPVALASAFMDSSAFLAITGNVPTQQFNRSPFQETGRYFASDFSSVVRPYVKRSFHVPRPEMLPIVVRQAFSLMTHGRPGPVHVDVPLNVFVERADVEIPEPVDWRLGIASRPAGDRAALERAVDLLLAAERPLIVAGQGIQLSGAAAELAAVAHALRIPVVTTPLGKGAFDERDPLALGPTGRNGAYTANQAARSCDVLLAVGTRFDDRATSAWIPGMTYSIPPTKLVHVDLDPVEIGRNYPVAVGIVADAKSALADIRVLAEARCGTTRQHHEPWLRDVEGWKTRWEADTVPLRSADTAPIRPERVITDLRAALADDDVVLADVGVHHNWLIQWYPTYRPATLLQSWGFASMCFGVAGVLGAQLAAPDRRCVAFVGDGGFLMMPSVVATAVEYDIPAVWVVFNNTGYVSIRDQQLGYFGQDRELATSFRRQATGDLYSADLAAIARGMGGEGALVERPQDFPPLLEEALRSRRPYVLDVRVDRDAKMPATGSWSLPPKPDPLPNYGWND
ncbi:MAG: thiamine pyrophosphate-binding protein [Chloroflexi bacterium]|nr:thiamine pyrophosphate-binding protein [Chloroflexota bacterium]